MVAAREQAVLASITYSFLLYRRSVKQQFLATRGTDEESSPLSFQRATLNEIRPYRHSITHCSLCWLLFDLHSPWSSTGISIRTLNARRGLRIVDSMAKAKKPETGEGYLGETMVHRISGAIGVVESVVEAKFGWPPEITLKLKDGSFKKGKLSDFREPSSAERKKNSAAKERKDQKNISTTEGGR